MWSRRALAALVVVIELVALAGDPADGRLALVSVPPAPIGDPGSDAATAALAADPSGPILLHRMTADDVARGLWALRRAGHPLGVDSAALADAIRLHARVGALREARRAAATTLAADGAALAARVPR